MIRFERMSMIVKRCCCRLVPVCILFTCSCVYHSACAWHWNKCFWVENLDEWMNGGIKGHCRKLLLETRRINIAICRNRGVRKISRYWGGQWDRNTKLHFYLSSVWKRFWRQADSTTQGIYNSWEEKLNRTYKWRQSLLENKKEKRKFKKKQWWS